MVGSVALAPMALHVHDPSGQYPYLQVNSQRPFEFSLPVPKTQTCWEIGREGLAEMVLADVALPTHAFQLVRPLVHEVVMAVPVILAMTVLPREMVTTTVPVAPLNGTLP